MNNTMCFYVALLFLSSITMAGDVVGNSKQQSFVDLAHELNLYDKTEIFYTHYPEASVVIDDKILYLRHTANLTPIVDGQYNSYKINNQHVIPGIVFEENAQDGSIVFKSTKQKFSMRFDRNNRKLLNEKMWILIDSMIDKKILPDSSWELHFIDPKYKHKEGVQVEDWYTLQLSAEELNHFKKLKEDKIQELTKKRNEDLQKEKTAQSNMQELKIKQQMKYENRLTIATRVVYFLEFIFCYLVYLKFR